MRSPPFGAAAALFFRYSTFWIRSARFLLRCGGPEQVAQIGLRSPGDEADAGIVSGYDEAELLVKIAPNAAPGGRPVMTIRSVARWQPDGDDFAGNGPNN